MLFHSAVLRHFDFIHDVVNILADDGSNVVRERRLRKIVVTKEVGGLTGTLLAPT